MKKDELTMSIGTLAKQTDLGVETIRYYERIGLLTPVGRKDSGYRIFNVDSLKTLLFLRKAQELGFTLSEIKNLLKLKADKQPRCQDVQTKAQKHLENVNDKIESLSKIKDVLSGLIQQCRQRKTDDCCPILECFNDPASGETKIASAKKRRTQRDLK
jgi:DNA-binding transcriptional MerR regulator